MKEDEDAIKSISLEISDDFGYTEEVISMTLNEVSTVLYC